MWFYKGIKVNISATTQNFIVALIYKIIPVQIGTIIAENTKNSLKSVPHTIESSIQNCEKFSPIVKLKLALFSSATAIVTPLLLIALMQSIKRWQLIAHKVYCEEKHTKVLQTCNFLSPMHFMFTGVTNAIGSISQDKQQLYVSNKNANLCKNAKNTKYSLTKQIKTNGSFFLHKKQCFNWFVQLATTTGCMKTIYNSVQDPEWLFPARWEKHPA